MLAASALSGQAAPLNQPNAPQSNYTQVDWQKPGRHVEKRVVKKKVVVKRNHWRNGQKYSSWKRHQSVRDWHRHGLRRPGPGQEIEAYDTGVNRVIVAYRLQSDPSKDNGVYSWSFTSKS